MSKRFGRNQKRKLIERQKAETEMVNEWTNNQINEANRRLRVAEHQRESMAAALNHALEQQFRPELRIQGRSDRPTVSVDMKISNNRNQAIINTVDLDIHAITTLANFEAKAGFVSMIAQQLVDALRHGQGLRIGF